MKLLAGFALYLVAAFYIGLGPLAHAPEAGRVICSLLGGWAVAGVFWWIVHDRPGSPTYVNGRKVKGRKR